MEWTHNIFFIKLELILITESLKKKQLLNLNRIYVCKILVCISGIYRHPRVLSEISSKYEFTMHIPINTKENALAGWFPHIFSFSLTSVLQPFTHSCLKYSHADKKFAPL